MTTYEPSAHDIRCWLQTIMFLFAPIFTQKARTRLTNQMDEVLTYKPS